MSLAVFLYSDWFHFFSVALSNRRPKELRLPLVRIGPGVRRYYRRTLNERHLPQLILYREKPGLKYRFCTQKISFIPNHDSQDSKINMIQFDQGSHGVVKDGGCMNEKSKIAIKKPITDGFKDFTEKLTSRSLGRGILSSVKFVTQSLPTYPQPKTVDHVER